MSSATQRRNSLASSTAAASSGSCALRQVAGDRQRACRASPTSRPPPRARPPAPTPPAPPAAPARRRQPRDRSRNASPTRVRRPRRPVDCSAPAASRTTLTTGWITAWICSRADSDHAHRVDQERHVVGDDLQHAATGVRIGAVEHAHRGLAGRALLHEIEQALDQRRPTAPVYARPRRCRQSGRRTPCRKPALRRGARAAIRPFSIPRATTDGREESFAAWVAFMASTGQWRRRLRMRGKKPRKDTLRTGANPPGTRAFAPCCRAWKTHQR